MYKVHITPHWEISKDNDAALDTSALLDLLLAVQEDGSIAKAAEKVKLSYRYAWGLLRDGEKLFGESLMTTNRGRGTVLTPLAEKLIWAERRISARLSPTLDSLSSELERELNVNSSENTGAIRLHASHGFAVAAMLNIINQENLTTEVRYRNSTDAVAALARKECDLAGFHVPLGEFEAPAVEQFLQWLNPKTHCLIHLAVRTQGLILASGNPKKIRGIKDLNQPNLNFVNRQKGSGTRLLLELMLAKQAIASKEIQGFDNNEFTHSAVAAFIASGMADVGFGVQTAAQRFGLDFIPLVKERYFFALSINALNDPKIQQIIGILKSAHFQQEVDKLVGYESGETGEIISITDAFGARKKSKTN
ncbi:substrate-binding domain-containing protein [Sapientia aquatica]|uniref:LysR family transcriptional regulator n=1 Tax=Sapientia aquatica TaxID=1549640 RepID=A0A4R5W833_9BURK|nr:substrate-binding domain-containing protein [Sapientia aquatica]TDK68445.1 LysR family transcriptional regulator [Sapientia aquatica]